MAEMSAASADLPGGRNPLRSTSIGVAVPADLRNLVRPFMSLTLPAMRVLGRAGKVGA